MKTVYPCRKFVIFIFTVAKWLCMSVDQIFLVNLQDVKVMYQKIMNGSNILKKKETKSLSNVK